MVWKVELPPGEEKGCEGDFALAEGKKLSLSAPSFFLLLVLSAQTRSIPSIHPLFPRCFLSQIHEKVFFAHSGSSIFDPRRDDGSFVVDTYANKDTQLEIFAVSHSYGFLKNVEVRDSRGHKYERYTDGELAGYKFLRVSDVPFDLVSELVVLGGFRSHLGGYSPREL
jgi:hypothetical protein